MDFSRIRRTRKVQVAVGGESFAVEYAPRRWNADFVEKHNALLEEEQEGNIVLVGRERYIFTLAWMLEGWEITDAGETVPVTEDFLAQVEDVFLFAMYSAVRNDIEAREEAKNS